ncbi:MAG: hypothetical protein ACOC5F_05340 [Candidatus Aminicenantaceae bacterium]
MKRGYNETGSNKLYIDNSDTSPPLIYGEFDNDLITITENSPFITEAISKEPETPGFSK